MYLCIQNHTQVTLTVQFTIYRNHLGFIFAIKFELRLQYHIKDFTLIILKHTKLKYIGLTLDLWQTVFKNNTDILMFTYHSHVR